MSAATAARLPIDERADQSPADVALQVWLHDRSLLESEHAQLYLVRPRSFEYFQTDQVTTSPFVIPDDSVFRALEQDLDAWFVQRRRGPGTRVFAHQREDSVWFLVRHGEPFKREDSLDGTRTTSVCYRPLRYDVLVYEHRLGELRIHARSVRERDLYRTQFGWHIFRNPHYFPGEGKYSLEPIRQRGVNCLVCQDVPGLEWVRLREVRWLWDGAIDEVETHQADDLFAALATRGMPWPEQARLIRAVFQVKFTDARRPRSVTIRPSNIALYTRDDDASLVEEWLRRRGFILMESASEEVADDTLVGA